MGSPGYVVTVVGLPKITIAARWWRSSEVLPFTLEFDCAVVEFVLCRRRSRCSHRGACRFGRSGRWELLFNCRGRASPCRWRCRVWVCRRLTICATTVGLAGSTRRRLPPFMAGSWFVELVRWIL